LEASCIAVNIFRRERNFLNGKKHAHLNVGVVINVTVFNSFGVQKYNSYFGEGCRENDFQLKFTYPTTEQLKNMNIINRDMTDEEKRRIKRGKHELIGLIEDLESGKIFIEDLGRDQVKRLREYLNKEGE